MTAEDARRALRDWFQWYTVHGGPLFIVPLSALGLVVGLIAGPRTLPFNFALALVSVFGGVWVLCWSIVFGSIFVFDAVRAMP
jgi:hypothetical protein